MPICRYRLLLILSFTVHFIFSQDYKIEGIVEDVDKTPLSYVNIMLLKHSDSTSIAGTSTESNGYFTLNNINPGTYFIKTSYIGYNSVYREITLDSNFNLGTIILMENIESLDGVTVTQQRPKLHKKGGKLIFEVENSTLSSMNTFEILQRTPGVISINDEISVKNLKTTVYINDKKVYLAANELKDLLGNFSGENIASIEVISNPSAKYDAEGGAVLNIITSKNISIGYKGAVNGTFEQAIFPKYLLGTSHYYKNNFLDLYAGYSYSPRKDYKRSDSYVNFFDGNTPSDEWETSLYKTTRSKAHNFNTIFDFTLDDKNTLSFTSNISYSPNKSIDNTVDTNIFSTEEIKEGSFITDSNLENDNTNIALNATYNREIGDNGANLSIQTNFVYYDDEEQQVLETDYYDANNAYDYTNAFDTESRQKNNIFTGQLDYTASLWQSNIEFGAKYSNISSNSRVVFSGDYMPDFSTDDNFSYDEDIWASYVNMNRDWGKWSFVAGLRGEYTTAIGNSIVLGEVNKQDYFELFPTFSLQHQISEKHQVGVSYKRAIERPRYQSLNPFRYYINENNFVAGNPFLKPSIESKIGFDYTFNGNYIFEIYYQQEKNDLTNLTFQRNEDQILYNSIFNVEESYQYSIDFVHYRSVTKWWYLSTYMSGFFYEIEFIARESNDVRQTKNTVGYFGQLYNSFTISKDRSLSADLYLEYVSRFYNGSYLMKDRFKTNIGLRKKLWNGRASLNMNLSDVFNTFNVPFTSRYLNQDNGYLAKPEKRTFSLGFIYKFGNFRLADNKRNIDFKEEERLNEEAEF
ncbi:TonB-dependent receptor [Joostella atrarenae]|uniref:TonB-dependent receptor n=1 Tax=Joostella atrarenae TaxID=679257 RepID=A0ABS9IZN4_9FLAO|nr:outer membrane beta-barrel family protein [Joostella atrarenae]MCF8713563.1 TonB-dependent receptor [Joostella atrarenae]